MLGLVTDFVSSPRGKWITLLAWVVLAATLISQLPRLAEVTENEQALFLPGDAESTRAFELSRERFPAEGTPTLIVVREPAGLSESTFAAVAEFEAWLTGPDAPDNVGHVRSPDPASGIGSGLVSPDGTTLYVFVELAGEPAEDAFSDSVGAIRDRAAALDLPGVEVAVGGPGGLIVDLVGVFASIDSFLLIVTVLLVLVLLILIYRSPIVALIPLLGVGLVFQLAGAVGAWVAQQFDLPISGQTTGIMTVVLFGTGTDYVLFVSARFREELTRHDDKHEAMRRTMRGVGGAVASAGATILIASAALMFATLRSYQTLGPVIAIAVGLMVLAALTLIPAVLTIGGRRAFWPMQPRLNAGRPRSRTRRRTGGAASTGGSAASCCVGRARRWQRPRRPSRCCSRACSPSSRTTISLRASPTTPSQYAASSCCAAASRPASSPPRASSSRSRRASRRSIRSGSISSTHSRSPSPDTPRSRVRRDRAGPSAPADPRADHR